MPKIEPPVHSRFKPGQSGNPGGRTRLPEELRAIKSLTQLEVCKLVSKYARMTRSAVQAAIQDAAIPMVDLAIAAIFVQCAKNGDFTRLAFLLDRSVGRPQECSPDTEEEDEQKKLENMTDAELLALTKQKIAEFEAA